MDGESENSVREGNLVWRMSARAARWSGRRWRSSSCTGEGEFIAKDQTRPDRHGRRVASPRLDWAANGRGWLAQRRVLYFAVALALPCIIS